MYKLNDYGKQEIINFWVKHHKYSSALLDDLDYQFYLIEGSYNEHGSNVASLLIRQCDSISNVSISIPMRDDWFDLDAPGINAISSNFRSKRICDW